MINTSSEKSGLITLLFFLSGSVSLLYEIVWARQLQFLFGSSIYSISTIIGSFFCGMALGSYLLGKWKSEKNPIVVYAAIEITIGLYCMASFFFIDIIDTVYLNLATAFLNGSPVVPVPIKFLLSFLLLILPTTLMGGSLPVLSRSIQLTGQNRGNKIGDLYGANTLGAVVGAFVTGFFLIERYGLSSTVLIGAYISIGIGITAILCRNQGYGNPQAQKTQSSNTYNGLYRLSLIAYAISGFCAIAYEVLWTRLLLQTFPGSTYTFSMILMLYLFGIAFGSIIGSRLTLRIKSPGVWFAIVQVLLAISIFGSIKLSGNVSLYNGAVGEGWFGYLLAMGLKTASLILIPSILMGILFPIMIQWYRVRSKDIGDAVGKIYSVNTVGGVLGSFCAGFLMIPFFGLTKSLVLLATINLLLGIFFLREAQFVKSLGRWKYMALSSLAIVIFVIYGSTGHLLEPDVPAGYELLFHKEGADANVNVYQSVVQGRENVKILKVNGVYQSGGTDKRAMVVQRRQGHLAMLLHDQPDSVLVIGLATGITLSAIAEHQKVKYLDCVEILSSQLDAAQHFESENQQVLSDRRVNIIIDDGRSHIKTSTVKYKVIVGDLFQMSSAGTANMFSVEHINACKDRLSEDGSMIQYIPLQQISEENLKSAISSFAHVFPFVQVWITETSDQTPVLAIVASPKVMRLNTTQIKARIQNSGAGTLDKVGYVNPYLMIGQCMMQTEAVKNYIENAKPFILDQPAMEFSAPRILTEPKDSRIRSILSNLLKYSKPLRIEIPNENYDEISKALSLFVEANKSNIIAELAVGKGQLRLAEKMLRESIQKIPDHFDTRRILGRTYVLIAIDLLRERKIENATDYLKKAQELGINDIMVAQLLKEAKNLHSNQ